MRRRKLIQAGSTIGVGLLAGCAGVPFGGDGGEPESTPTVDTDPEVTDPTPADCKPEVVSDDIEADTTWNAADCPRVALDGNVRVTDEATLTIEPGVEVIGQSGSRLTVLDDAALVASGDPENPVWFHGESEAPGYWQGIWIKTDNPNNSFDNVDIAHGGANDYANIYLEGTAGNGHASVTNSTLRESATAGLIAEEGATLAEFATNEFRDNEGPAVYIPTTLAGSIDADSTYIGDNGTDAVRVSSHDVEDDATWPGVPYRFDGQDHTLTDGAVTVEPGARFTFGDGARIQVRAGSSFTAEGTGDSPITFEGASATPGHWQGIWIKSDNPNNSFDNVDIAHGGANDYANIYLEGTAGNGHASVTNSTLRESATWGIYVEEGAALVESSNNTFEDNEEGGIRRPES